MKINLERKRKNIYQELPSNIPLESEIPIPKKNKVVDTELLQKKERALRKRKVPLQEAFHVTEAPANLDNLSITDIIPEKKRTRTRVPKREAAITSQESSDGLPKDPVKRGKFLEQLVERGLATEETVPPDTNFPEDPFYETAEVPAQKATVQSIFEKPKVIQRYPVPENPWKPKREKSGFFSRFKNYFLKDLEDEDE